MRAQLMLLTAPRDTLSLNSLSLNSFFTMACKKIKEKNKSKTSVHKSEQEECAEVEMTKKKEKQEQMIKKNYI
jgi:hypothetical protein